MPRLVSPEGFALDPAVVVSVEFGCRRGRSEEGGMEARRKGGEEREAMGEEREERGWDARGEEGRTGERGRTRLR